MLAEHTEGPGGALPVNIMFVDAENAPWRGVITATGERRILH
jgi:hypothetical protein